jgi:hypothetical protein
MERRFNGRHCLLIDLARVVSAFFLFYFLSTLTFLSFSFLSTIPNIGEFVYYVSVERDQRWTAGMHRTEWYPKRNIVLY